jgi:phthalate 4,5-dioxygenase
VPLVDEHFVPIRNRENDYLIDRNAQENLTFTGVQGVAEQDAMIQDSQGLIADRTRENLTATDSAVVRFRRTFLGGVKALAEGKAPAAAHNGGAYRLRSGSWVADKSHDFAAIMVQRFGDPIGRINK